MIIKPFETYIVACSLLIACNAPSPAFRGIPSNVVTVEGSTFSVRVNGDRAEAIRTNAQYAPRFGPIKQRATTAIEQVSGCEVRSIDGDQALAIAKLKCP